MGRLVGIAWNIVALFFVASVLAAPVVAFVVRKARARGRRLFRDVPNARLGVPTTHERYSA